MVFLPQSFKFLLRNVRELFFPNPNLGRLQTNRPAFNVVIVVRTSADGGELGVGEVRDRLVTNSELPVQVGIYLFPVDFVAYSAVPDSLEGFGDLDFPRPWTSRTAFLILL